VQRPRSSNEERGFFVAANISVCEKRNALSGIQGIEIMAGYSGTPLPKKLGISDGSFVALIGAPDGFEDQLVPLRVGVSFVRRATNGADVVLFFARSRGDLAKRLIALVRKLPARGGLWVAWPKKSSGVATDLAESDVREAGLALGLVDNKVCAIDDVWSGLRFVVPLARRSTWPPAGAVP
jgi:hypothetical protein